MIDGEVVLNPEVPAIHGYIYLQSTCHATLLMILKSPRSENLFLFMQCGVVSNQVEFKLNQFAAAISYSMPTHMQLLLDGCCLLGTLTNFLVVYIIGEKCLSISSCEVPYSFVYLFIYILHFCPFCDVRSLVSSFSHRNNTIQL